MHELMSLQTSLHYTFTNEQLLIEALTHKSFKQPYNNERLEFLGDAVMDLIVGEYLYTKFPQFDEGKLSKMRASLVNEDGFAKLANHLKLGNYILLSKAEESNGGRSKPSLLSNAFEAVIGAIYLEAGLDQARKIAIEMLELYYPNMSLDNLFKDYKTTLQEMTQAHFGITPEYKLVGSRGPDHKKEFEIMVSVDHREYGRSIGKSKKDAQQKAAKIAIAQLKQEVS